MSVLPDTNEMTRACRRPALVSHQPLARTVGTRTAGCSDATRAAATPCRSISASVKHGLLIFRTPSGCSDPAVRTRKFWSCWLPSGSSAASMPNSAARSAVASAVGSTGDGSSGWEK